MESLTYKLVTIETVVQVSGKLKQITGDSSSNLLINKTETFTSYRYLFHYFSN